MTVSIIVAQAVSGLEHINRINGFYFIYDVYILISFACFFIIITDSERITRCWLLQWGQSFYQEISVIIVYCITFLKLIF